MLNGLCKLHYFCLWKKTSKRCVFNKILKCWYFVSRRKYREANRVSSCANVSEFCDVICGQRKHIHIYIHTHPMSVAWWNQSHTHWKLKHSRADYTQMTYNIPSVCVLHLVKIIRRPKPTETIPQDRQVPLGFLPPPRVYVDKRQPAVIYRDTADLHSATPTKLHKRAKLAEC